MLNTLGFTLTCDVCGEAHFATTPNLTLKTSPSWQCLNAAGEAGWTRHGEKDFCPACERRHQRFHLEDQLAQRCAAFGPEVEVIAYTQFGGVPDALLPEEGTLDYAKQDRGSDGARLIETAGRTCYDSFGKGRTSEAYHQHLLEVGHGSVLEHSSISFFISRASRNLTHELVRHRVGVAYSQRSTRYVDESASEIAWHPLIGKLPHEARHNLQSWVGIAQRAYVMIAADLERQLTEAGLSPTDARKQARGAARGVLPSALSTKLVATFNLRALRHFIELRATDAADAEIRLLAWRMFVLARGVVPEFFDDYAVA